MKFKYEVEGKSSRYTIEWSKGAWHCTCEAGRRGKKCRHRKELFDGMREELARAYEECEADVARKRVAVEEQKNVVAALYDDVRATMFQDMAMQEKWIEAKKRLAQLESFLSSAEKDRRAVYMAQCIADWDMTPQKKSTTVARKKKRFTDDGDVGRDLTAESSYWRSAASRYGV